MTLFRYISHIPSEKCGDSHHFHKGMSRGDEVYCNQKRFGIFKPKYLCAHLPVVFKNTDNIVFPICPSHTTLVFFGALSLQPPTSALAPWYRVRG